MAFSVYLSETAPFFHGHTAPECGTIAGYSALIHSFGLPAPLPNVITLISDRHRKYTSDVWQVLGHRYLPNDTLYGHLVLAFRYEGIQLLVLKKLFENLSRQQVIDLIKIRPNGQYSRKIWFLYEWLMDEQLPLPDTDVKTGYKPLLDEQLQYGIHKGIKSARHRVINNLPGTRDFCPLVFKSQKLEKYINQHLSGQAAHNDLNRYAKDLLNRTSSFLLLQDSKASFTIEGESPENQRAIRWGKAIGQAGTKSLSREEILRLQEIVISDKRFVKFGLRDRGGFVGEHDRSTGRPVPDHISAKPEELDHLIKGLTETEQKLENVEIDPVIAATIVAFGFVFIHPLQDGNGRIHRYLVHHVLAKKGFTPQGMIFPISASILDHIDDYRKVLQHFSHPLLDYIEWQVTSDNNVEALNNTIDYYRYFDATPQAEFLYDMVRDTIERIIPEEVQYLQQYDEFKRFIDERFDMPDSTVSLLVRFLGQNQGRLSKRARRKEFNLLNDEEAKQIEETYQKIFMNR